MSENISLREKLEAIYDVTTYRPNLSAPIVVLSVISAFLEGIGLSFILPIIEQARNSSSTSSNGLLEAFKAIYEFVGIPFTLEYIILGVCIVMTVRYSLSFVVAWLRLILQMGYLNHIRQQSYEAALTAEIDYFDEQGSDDILNAIITQSQHASGVIGRLIKLLQIVLISLMYLAVAVYMAPGLTFVAVLILGVATLFTRNIFESAFSVGEEMAEANERIQSAVQAGTQGIRDAKLFGMRSEFLSDFRESMDTYVETRVKQRRNASGINNFHSLISAVSVFILIYLAFRFASLSIASLGLFLFAMFRLAPRVSTFNDHFYRIEADIPHLVRALDFIKEIESHRETSGDEPAPNRIGKIEFEDVSFGYEANKEILTNVSFEAKKDEFIAFVGESGAGKSTIVSLLAKLYTPDSGHIRANGTSIERFELESWRERIAVVRQHPFIFNETLWDNITIGNREATEQEVERVSEIAKVDEFLDGLPDGYETLLGDDGVRLSGGQKQRVALARALLKDADVLILDEATSDLDTNIEAQVQSEIESMESDYITVTIAHRLSTVKNADRIYTVVDGEITDVGNHYELLDRNGKYSDLYTA